MSTTRSVGQYSNVFHDESTFKQMKIVNFLGYKGKVIVKSKGKGSGIMMSEFISEKNGYLCLTQEEYRQARETDPSIQMEARCLFEYGEAKQTCDKFIQ